MRIKFIKNNQGAALPLVLFLAAAVITIGASSLSAAALNRKLTGKSAEYNAAFYGLDADGQIFAQRLDAALSEAEEAAVNYVIAGGYGMEKYEGIPADLQANIMNEYNKTAYSLSVYDDQTELEAVIAASLNKIYFYEAEKAINAMRRDLYFSLSEHRTASWKSPDFSVLPLSNGNIVSAIYVTMTFYSESDENYHLTVELAVSPPFYAIKKTPEGVNGTRDFSSARYFVNEWRQWQTPQIKK
ncbi:hypothetical protein FACS189490_09180 [Clostridia bacterium]|nr:hypothetical protein FACS189490_09180 [Clostridia bacterium]